MAKSRSASVKKKDSRKSAAPPPPPPVVHGVASEADLRRHVTEHAGAALLVVVSPLDANSTNSVVAAVERLNNNRPPQLADVNLAVCYATPLTTSVCHALGVTTVPFAQSYAYGEPVASFVGDNTDKMELIAKVAALQAGVKTAQLAEERQRQAAAAEEHECAAADGVTA